MAVNVRRRDAEEVRGQRQGQDLAIYHPAVSRPFDRRRPAISRSASRSSSEQNDSKRSGGRDARIAADVQGGSTLAESLPGKYPKRTLPHHPVHEHMLAVGRVRRRARRHAAPSGCPAKSRRRQLKGKVKERDVYRCTIIRRACLVIIFHYDLRACQPFANMFKNMGARAAHCPTKIPSCGCRT